MNMAKDAIVYVIFLGAMVALPLALIELAEVLVRLSIP